MTPSVRHASTCSPALLALPALIALSLSGCGRGSAASQASAVAPSTSGAAAISTALVFRSLERGEQSAVVNSPADAFSTRLAASDPELSALWSAHGSSRALPQVDFSRERVVGLFLGERPTSGFALEVVDVAAVGTSLEVRYARSLPAPGQPRVLTRPFDIVAFNDTGAALRFVDVTPAPTTRPLAEHGELVEVQGALAFLPEGAPEALEIVDVTALRAAGAHAGWTGVLRGDVEPNLSGATSLSEALRLVSFDLDTLVTTGEVYTLRTLVPPSPTLFRDVDGASYEPIGPLAAALLAAPQQVPYRLSGRVTGQGTYGALLEVTSYRPALRLGFTDTRPLLSSESIGIDDLDQTGAYRVEASSVMSGSAQTTRGRGRRLETTLLADLRQAVAAADLKNQPAVFRPAQIYPDHPSVSLSLRDAAGAATVRVYSGASVPRAIADLIQRMRAFRAAVPTATTFDQGDASGITRRSAQVCRDAGALTRLYASHRPGVRPPAVDFTQDTIVGAFAGQQTTGGYRFEVARVERIGSAIHLTTKLTPPSGPAPSVLTAPYHLLRMTATRGEVYVDGVLR